MSNYAQTHHTLWYSPKFSKLSFAARGLWATCQSWCAGQLTDGLIPERDVREIGGSDAQIRALIKSGLWEEAETEDGELAYQFHDWLDHNEPAEKISAKRRREKERSAARRQAEKAKKAAESRGDSGQTSDSSDPNLPQTSDKFGRSFSGGTRAELGRYETDRVVDRTVSKEKGTEGNTQERDSARPSGGSPPEAETETRDEGGRQEGTGCQIIRLADLSARTLPRRWSALTKDSETAEAQETASEPKPLEEMTPKELLDYIVTFQWEVNNIRVDGGPAGVDTMRKFQNDYGPERAAQIIRELFVNHQGKYKITKEVEAIGYRHFSQGVRWWIEKIDLKLQSKAKDEAYVESSLKFATDL